MVGVAEDLRLLGREPPPRKLLGPRAVAIRLRGVSPIVFVRSLLLLLSGSHLATDATPSVGRRRVSCSVCAGAVFLVRVVALRRSCRFIFLNFSLGFSGWFF